MNELLLARDKRVELIESFLTEDKTVISLRCNYPGTDKNNEYTQKVIQILNKVMMNRFRIFHTEFLNSYEGPIYLYLVEKKPNVKLKTIEIENNHPLGRLVDIDVYQESIKSLSRSDFNEQQRKCFLCDDLAINCIVNKRHKLEDLKRFFIDTIESYDRLPLEIIEYTNQAMMYELVTFPSFGLVSPFSRGAHKDMDHYTFIDSCSVLNKYMIQFAKLGYQDKNIEDMISEAIQIGLACEKDMYKKTGGINTHKGLIFVLGTLVVSSMKALYQGDSFETIFNNCSILTKNKLNELKQLNGNKLSNGEKVFLKYHKEGVRKEASLGFPTIQEALKVIDIENKETLVKTLIYIMSLCEDTTIINRKGVKVLNDVKHTMKDLINNGYDNKLLLDINEQFIKEGISPGGSADLLCGTIFLSLIKNKMSKRRERR